MDYLQSEKPHLSFINNILIILNLKRTFQVFILFLFMYSFMLKTTHNPPTMNDKTHLKKKNQGAKINRIESIRLMVACANSRKPSLHVFILQRHDDR